MIKIFLDTEFTGLRQHTKLISIAMVADDGKEFYAELNDYLQSDLNDWLLENVIEKLYFNHVAHIHIEEEATTQMKGSTEQVAQAARKWLEQFDFIEIWADVLAYDWVLFCELFGGAFGIPENIFFAPFDLATALRLSTNEETGKNYIMPKSKYKDDVSRFELAGVDKSKQHHALEDARVEKICWDKIFGR